MSTLKLRCFRRHGWLCGWVSCRTCVFSSRSITVVVFEVVCTVFVIPSQERGGGHQNTLQPRLPLRMTEHFPTHLFWLIFSTSMSRETSHKSCTPTPWAIQLWHSTLSRAPGMGNIVIPIILHVFSRSHWANHTTRAEFCIRMHIWSQSQCGSHFPLPTDSVRAKGSRNRRSPSLSQTSNYLSAIQKSVPKLSVSFSFWSKTITEGKGQRDVHTGCEI